MKKMKLKTSMLAVSAVVAAIAADSASAQSSVNIYGLLDTGVMYVSNVGGNKLFKIDPGAQAPNLWGITGREDLGGGLKAVFKLEGQIDLNSGAAINGLFGHQAYVGVSDSKYGTLTAGNQIDFMFDSLIADRWGPAFPFVNAMSLRQGGFVGLDNRRGFMNGSFDFDRSLGAPIANSIKYQSPVFSGLSFGAQYAFGGVAGSFSTNSGQSYGVNYHIGNVSLNGAYTYIKSYDSKNFPTAPESNIRNFGFGTSWVLGNTELGALYTNTANTVNGAQIGVYEADVTYTFSPFLHAHLEYQYMKGNGVLNNAHANQETLTVLYSLSKRTSIYSALALQQASGMNAQILMTPGASSGGRQTAFDLGLIHSF
ncbi:putative porin [Paraburkholderia atlantica]